MDHEDTHLAAQRLAEIRRLLKERGVIRVDELSRLTGVSVATTRRDLAELNKLGQARRVHGGVMSVEGNLEEPVFDDKAYIAGEQKQRIARCALDFIKTGDSVFLDGGSTVLALARLLTEMTRLTVVTNSLKVAGVLSGSGPRVIVTGGELRRLSQTFVGPTTAALLDQVFVDKAFMGTIGLSEKEGLTTTDPAEAFTKQKVMSRATQVILMADMTKAGKVSFCRFGGIEDVAVWVTDAAPDKAMSGRLQKKGVTVVQAG